jgi:hypothetical protein
MVILVYFQQLLPQEEVVEDQADEGGIGPVVLEVVVELVLLVNRTGGTGNTPPVSPPQGNNGGNGFGTPLLW